MISDILKQPDNKKIEIKSQDQGVNTVPFHRVKHFIKRIRSANYRKFFSRETVLTLQEEGKVLGSMTSFFGLLLLFILELIWKGIKKIKVFAKAGNKLESFWVSKLGELTGKIVNRLESKRGGIKRAFLIALAFRNMRVKKTRSLVTIGGMSLGIAAIVFLVSIGYGLQRVVTSRVARLEELQMADITLGSSTNLKFNTNVLRDIKNIPQVEKVMPVISLVGRINFEGGVGESVVYGATSDYLKSLGLKKLEGDYYDTNEFALIDTNVKVAGATTEWKFETARLGKDIREISFNVEEDSVLRLREDPNLSGEILGYVKRVEGGYDGMEVWGDQYPGNKRGRIGESVDGETLGKWVKSPLPIWEKTSEGEYVPLVDEKGVQEWRDGYVAQVDELIVDEESSDLLGLSRGMVLGDSATASAESLNEVSRELDKDASISAVVIGTDDQGVEWVELEGESASGAADLNIFKVDLPESALRKAVVNSAFVKLLGLESKQAVGKSFEISFVILQNLKPDLDRPMESKSEEYEIVAVVEDDAVPVVYVALEDITKLGVENYSQVKLMVENQRDLEKVREQVDILGYKTSSVADTVAQIDSLFSSVRIILGVFGLVALTVASLGMFNTLTVSLMERTREVGVMKAMGMKSDEVKELFLAEAMVMGLFGGVFGILLGVASGKFLSLLLSVMSLINGLGFIDISYVPPVFITVILVLSFSVGVVTGIYPARRATKISALNALRYE